MSDWPSETVSGKLASDHVTFAIPTQSMIMIYVTESFRINQLAIYVFCPTGVLH